MSYSKSILCVIAASSILAVQQASASIIAVDLGTANPPTTLGGYTMTPYDPGSIDGASARTVGYGWATWGQGYTGTVYVSGGQTVTLNLSDGTKAVYFYITGVSVTTLINGYYGSAGVGFYVDGLGSLKSISVTCTDPTGFAIGEFGINGGTISGTVRPVPEPASYFSGALVLCLTAFPYIRRRFFEKK